MIEISATAFFELVTARHGHFRLESGHHSRLWLDLDSLFAEPHRVDPFVAALATGLRPYGVAIVCGPLVGGAIVAQLVARALGVEFCFTERVLPSGDRGMFQAQYPLPAAFVARVSGKRVAIVDDVMSAGSALRGTYEELERRTAVPVVAGALLVLGSTGADFFAQRGLPVEAVTRSAYELWAPSECPLCEAGVPVEDAASSTALGTIRAL